LAKTIEGLVELVHIAFLAVVREPQKLGNVDLLLDITIEERRFYVEVLEIPLLSSSDRHQDTHRVEERHWTKHLVEVDNLALHIALGNQAIFVLDHGASDILLFVLNAHLRPMGYDLHGA
jgi:hypothetical protein